MRVINIVPAISNEASGPSYSVIRLCESLIETGTEVSLAALDWGPINKSPVFLRTFPLGFGPRRLGRSPAMARWLDAEAGSGRVALLHNHGMWQLNAVYPGRAARRYRIPLVVSPRGSWSEWAISSGSAFKKPFWSLLQRPAVEAAACFHATAPSEYQAIRRLGFRQPVAIIPNGIDIPLPQKKTMSDLRTLLFLGRIHPVKGLDMLLPAWGAVQGRFPDWRLRIVGGDGGFHASSGYLDQIQRMAKKLGLQRIEFAGALFGHEKWAAYAEANLFVLPSYSENFGVSVAEALAAGTPVIVSKGAPWSGIETHDAGQWIDIGRNPLVAALEDLMSRSPESLREMGQRGRGWMHQEYSWARIGQQMAEVYKWISGVSTMPPACVKLD